MNDSIERLKKRIVLNELEDESDLLHYLRLASRMKALGDSCVFDMIPAVLKKSWYVETADSAIACCCQELIWYCEQPILDEEVVWIMIQAQDMKLFYEYAQDKEWYPEDTRWWFEELFRAVSKVQLNEACLTAFKSWLNMYQIPEEYRLIK